MIGHIAAKERTDIFEKNGYVPWQPAFETFGISYHNKLQPPATDLDGIVADFYEISRADFKKDSLMTIPDGCTDFMFVSKGSQLRSYVSAGVRTNKEFYFGEAEFLFGIRFMPGGTYRVFPDPIRELVHHPIPLSCIMHNTDILLEQFFACQSFAQRVELLSDYVRANLRQRETRYEILNGLARYLQELCNDYIGISPKEFCQTVRMQYALALEQKNPQAALAVLASMAGYADLSHMNREFKKYMSCKLSDIKKNKIRKSGQMMEQIVFPVG